MYLGGMSRWYTRVYIPWHALVVHLSAWGLCRAGPHKPAAPYMTCRRDNRAIPCSLTYTLPTIHSTHNQPQSSRPTLFQLCARDTSLTLISPSMGAGSHFYTLILLDPFHYPLVDHRSQSSSHQWNIHWISFIYFTGGMFF